MKFSFFAIFLIPIIQLGAELKFDASITPFLNQYCLDCHGGKKVKGKIDFTVLDKSSSLEEHHELFENSLDVVIHHDMPPEDELQPSEAEIESFKNWVLESFDKNVVAKAGPGVPRLLSSHELSKTLNDLFQVELEVNVAKAEETEVETSLVKRVLPIDPPGESGFKNDTRHRLLTPALWESYSYIFDVALRKLFSESAKAQLEKFAGHIHPDGGWAHQNSVQLLKSLLPRIYRRPLSKQDLQDALSYLEKDKPSVASVQHELKVALMSSRFLYRGLSQKREEGQHPVDAFEYAERLSYFIWGSMPDEDLFQKALKNRLQKPDEIRNEIVRMLKDSKSQNLSRDFAYQWLALSEIKNLGGRTTYVNSLLEQPLRFFDYLVCEDRPLMELIDSDRSYANYLVAKFYPKDRHQLPKFKNQRGIEMAFQELSPIELQNTQNRGGILTMPGILSMNAAKNRTSPILRGTWMLERILGEHLPEPPMDVSPVPPNKKGEVLTFRERFERHRSDNACAVCHNRIDPLGFALESFDSNGAFRTHHVVNKKDKVEIDASGAYKGNSFQTFAELKHLLLTEHREDIIRNITKKMLSYALCRSLELSDKPVVEEIVEKMVSGKGTFQDLIYEIVTSMPFKEIYTEKKDV